MDGGVADRRHGIDADTDGVLLDGIDDAAIGGLPEVSMMLCRLPDGIDGAYDEMPNCRA